VHRTTNKRHEMQTDDKNNDKCTTESGKAVVVSDRDEIFAHKVGEKMTFQSRHDVMKLKRCHVSVLVFVVPTERLKCVHVVKVLQTHHTTHHLLHSGSAVRVRCLTVPRKSTYLLTY